MDSYAPLLEKLRLPQPSLQRFAVTSIFSKLRAAPQHLNSDSGPGREAISQCLLHSSPAVVDQSVRELCRLVKESYIDVSRALMELQAALEGSESRFVDVFVKGLGFLVQFGFQKHNGSWQFGSAENHPFVKVLSCRVDVQAQLLHQIPLFMVQNKSLGMEAVCEFLSPFVKHSILRTQLSDSSSSLFVRNLMSSIMSVCCSLPQEALPIFDLLIQSLKYVPRKTLEDFWNFIHLVESLVDACTVVLRLLVSSGSHLIMEAQQRSLELLDTILSLYASLDRHVCGFERIIELSTYLLSVQKDLKMQYVSKLSSAFPSLFTILIKSELEHEQLLILKLLLSLLQWKAEHEYANRVTTLLPSEELLFVFPAISLMSSPSKCIKGAATELLSILEKLLVTLLVTTKDEVEKERAFHFSLISTPGSIIVKLLEKLWFQGLSSQSSGFFLDFAIYGLSNSKDDNDLPKMCWTSKLREYSLWIVDRRKSLLPLTQFEELFVREMPFLVSAITSIMVVHHSLASDAVELLAALGTLDPKIGFQLFLLFLFYCNIFSRKEVDRQDMVLKLLALLPCLASHSAMVPFIVEAISPMLRKDSNPVLYATATRLLCQSWEKNDRVFGSLQRVLLPNGFSDFVHEREICLSLAASIRDVCRKDADRGVDLILSVSACIESPDPINQALGFQGLAHLCEADVIDFYTAWDVIAEYPLDYSANPVLANSLCNLLRWGAIDAEVYPEASKDIIGILFTVGTSTCPCHDLQWTKAKASAFDALSQYEVSLLERSIVDFKERSTSVLFTETDVNILSAIKGLLVKIIAHEHSNRRRLVKEKRVAGSKIEKLLDVYPRLVFSSGNSTVRELPAAALLCLSFSSRKGNDPERRTKDEHASYVDAMCEIAESLQLSRNIVMALLALESWKAFMERWLKSEVFSFDVRDTAVISEKTCKAANAILKSIIHAAEEALPRSAENMALAIGALCMVLPQAAHAVKSTAAKFLLNWLFQHEHEHRQWPSAISLGIISRCLHVTDHKLKFQNISGLLEVLSVSKSTLVKGACGVGLGYSSHNLLSGVEIVDKSNLVKDKQTTRIEDVELLGTIVRALSLMICQLIGSSTDMLEDLFTLFPVHSFDISVDAHLLHENGDFEEDVWGVAGLILGLGNTIVAVYKAGTYNAVLEIKRLIFSWMPHGNSVLQYSDSFDDNSVRILSVGSCLALPAVMTFCHRFELMNGDELGHLIDVYKETISELLSVKKSTTSHQNLLMASCIGAGNLLAGILNEGVCSIEVGCVQDLLELFRRCYSNPYSPLIHFGGMLGVVNAMGVGVGSLFNVHPTTSSVQIEHDLKESSHLMGPLLSSRVCEPLLTSVMQEMYLVAQNSDDKKLQQYAAWAVSFLRHNIWSKKSPNLQNLNETDESGSRSIPQNFQVDGVVMRLCNWLKQLNLSGTGPATYIDTLVTILRCLSQAPRLPSLDWGVIIRRCMRYEDQVAESLPQSSALRKGILREECLKFSLAHANQFDQLLIFLDELSDISRFRTLALNLQSCLLIHLAGLMNVFSNSRVEKLFNDMKNYLFSSYSNQLQYNYEKHLLFISCWKGLYQCLEEASLNSLECISHIENFMEVLFIMLPTSPSGTDAEVDEVHSTKEWSEAIRCLGKARPAWLLNFLQVSSEDLVLKDEKFFEVIKKMKAKAKLTRNGSLPLSELGKLKILMLNLKLQDVWDVLVEVVAALQLAEGNVKRQWLVDTVEISCVSVHPSTALHFLGLLSGSFSKYMPLLILEPHAVLKDLPVTLNSLISTSGWGYIAEPIASHLLASTERILNANSIHSSQPIDESETETTIYVMHNTCVSLKDFLPLEEQLRLANMNIITQQRG